KDTTTWLSLMNGVILSVSSARTATTTASASARETTDCRIITRISVPNYKSHRRAPEREMFAVEPRAPLGAVVETLKPPDVPGNAGERRHERHGADTQVERRIHGRHVGHAE